MSDSDSALIILVALEGIHIYGSFLPSTSTIQEVALTTGGKKTIREDEVVASTLLLAIALSISVMIKSHWPLLMAVISGGTMLAVYEHAMTRR